MQSAPIPYDLEDLLANRPSGLIRPWTKEQNSIVGSLLICWMHVEAWEWGTKEDWDNLGPLFNQNGDYLG